MTDKLLWILLAILATYRTAGLFALDDGPFDCFKNLRYFFVKQAHKNTFFHNCANLITCPYCIGIWIAILFGIIVTYWLNPVTELLLIILAIAGGQTFLESRGNDANHSSL